MKTHVTITARDSDRVVTIKLTAQSVPFHYTKGEHARFRHDIEDGIHAALKEKFFAAQIRIK